MKTLESTLSDDIFITLETTREAGTFPAYHSHNVYEIYILASGNRTMFIGNIPYSVVAGDAAMIQPHIPHRSYGNTPYSGICIEFSGKYINDNFSADEVSLILSCFSKPIISLDIDSLDLLWQKAKDIINKDYDKHEYLLMAARIFSEKSEKTNIELKHSFESDLSPIGNYIQEHYKNIKGLDELCEHFGVSKSYICRIFKRHTGITVIEYINRLKIQHAYQLLQETDLPINEISRQSGFETVIYFNRLFKKIMGDTPQNARKTAKENWTYIE